MKTLKKACLLLALALIPLGSSGKAYQAVAIYNNETGHPTAAYITSGAGVVWGIVFTAAVAGPPGIIAGLAVGL